MTTAGRAVKMVMRQRVAARSMRILGTEADSSFFLSRSRICRSSISSLPKSFFSANHLDAQSLVTATRRPIGLVFWPILTFVGQNNLDMATPFEDGSRRTPRFGCEPLHRRGSAGHRFFDAQGFGFQMVVVLGVGHGRA